jgi:hypothetical protein
MYRVVQSILSFGGIDFLIDGPALVARAIRGLLMRTGHRGDVMGVCRAVLCGVLSATLAASGAAVAQPAGLRDLVGARGGGGEIQMRQRGYAWARTDDARGAKLSYWRRGDDCVRITTRDGRYQRIEAMEKRDCGGDSDAAAALTGVAIVGLAAALAAHKKQQEDGGGSHDAEYDRGYRDGFAGVRYDGGRDSEGYHEGFIAGEAEHDNRRYADTAWVRKAPQAARDACARRADELQNRPPGSSVPVSVRDLGRSDYELTVATGPYRSRCVVSGYGAVRSIAPY